MWEAIKWYSQNGFRSFNFGKTEPTNKGLLQYKRGWGTKEQSLRYYKYDLTKDRFVSKKEGYKKFYKIFKQMPIPLLRLIGNVFYRHVG
jgi:hypothetical protein